MANARRLCRFAANRSHDACIGSDGMHSSCTLATNVRRGVRAAIVAWHAWPWLIDSVSIISLLLMPKAADPLGVAPQPVPKRKRRRRWQQRRRSFITRRVLPHGHLLVAGKALICSLTAPWPYSKQQMGTAAVMWDGSNGSRVPPFSNEGFTHSLGGRRLAYVYSCHRVSGRRWNVDIAGPLLGGRARPPGRLWCQAESLTSSKNHTKVREPCDA